MVNAMTWLDGRDGQAIVGEYDTGNSQGLSSDRGSDGWAGVDCQSLYHYVLCSPVTTLNQSYLLTTLNATSSAVVFISRSQASIRVSRSNSHLAESHLWEDRHLEP